MHQIRTTEADSEEQAIRSAGRNFNAGGGRSMPTIHMPRELRDSLKHEIEQAYPGGPEHWRGVIVKAEGNQE